MHLCKIKLHENLIKLKNLVCHRFTSQSSRYCLRVAKVQFELEFCVRMRLFTNHFIDLNIFHLIFLFSCEFKLFRI